MFGLALVDSGAADLWWIHEGKGHPRWWWELEVKP